LVLSQLYNREVEDCMTSVIASMSKINMLSGDNSISAIFRNNF
jgi:hypothetical protein